jgi:arylsulfatase
MRRGIGTGDWIAGLLLTAAAIGAAGWLDALRVANGAAPGVPWQERASLAALDGLWLLAAIVPTLLAVWGWDALRRSGSRDRARGSGAAPRVLAGWSAAFGLLALGGFEPKFGWMAGAALAGILAGWIAGRWTRRIGDAAPARLPALAILAAALWGSMGILAAIPTGGRPSSGPAAGAPGGRPNFLLIVIDALRADHLGAYGYARPTSPSIDRFAGGAVLFRNAVAPSAWTLPSMASILTSTYPGEHGTVERGDRLPGDLVKLAGRLRSSGYRTAAFTTNPWLKRTFAFDDGFDEYADLDRLSLARRLAGIRLKNLVLRRAHRIRLDPELVPLASEISGRAAAWLRGNGSEPFFLYLHYMDVHAPYNPIPKYHGRFCEGHHFDVPDFLLESRFRNGDYKGNAEVLDHVVELYDEDVAATDEAIGSLLDGVRAMGLDGRTTIVLTADHGEEFYEHGETTHGHDLYREVLHVPLIVAPAGDAPGTGKIVAERVSTLDLLPTLVAMAGIDAPPKIEGISLVPLLARGAAEWGGAARPIGSQLVENGRSWAALYLGDDKMVRLRPAPDDPSARTVTKLFHLAGDEAERSDAAASEPALASKLASDLDALERVWGIAGRGAKRPGERVDPETLRQLKALGYIN